MTSFPQETYFKQWQTWKAKRCLEKCKTGLPKRGELDRHCVFLLLHSSPICVSPCLPDNAVSRLCVWKHSEEFEFQGWKRWCPFTPHSTFSVRVPHPQLRAQSASTHHLPLAKHFRKVPLSARRHHLHHTDLMWKHPFFFHPELNCSIQSNISSL